MNRSTESPIHCPTTRMDSSGFIPILSGADRSRLAAVLRAGLTAAEFVYGGVVRGRNVLFDAGARKTVGLGRPVISVGNLTTGGTGKTPLVIALAQTLVGFGAQPAVLLRGYRGADGESDEAAVLLEALGAVTPVAPGARRAAVAAALLERRPDVDVLLLDDGFQHRQVHRDLDLVLIDATQPFGFDRLLPRGLLREPLASLRRADAVIVTRADQVGAEVLARIDERIAAHAGQPPVAHAAHQWTGFVDARGRSAPAAALQAARVVGACGIGNPRAFEHTLAAHAGTVAAMCVFADHHAYAAEDVRRLREAMQEHSADALVTTEKDWAKLRHFRAELAELALYRPVLRLAFLDGGPAVTELLRQAWRPAC